MAKTSNYKLRFKLQALFCVALTLQLQFLTAGCGQGGLLGLPGAGVYQIQLTADHPMTTALKGSAFQGAKLMEILPQAQTFRLIFSDSTRQVSGRYSFANGEFTITQFSIKRDGQSATMSLDETRRVTSISSSDGTAWVREFPAGSAKASSSALNSDNPYVIANADLVEMAERVDAQGGVPGTGGQTGSDGGTTQTGGGGVGGLTPKGGNLDAIDGASFVLAIMAAIWAPLAGILQPLLALFTFATLLEGSVLFRFDGNWRASNASSNLIVTINHGKITRLVDESSQQELTVVRSEIDDVSGSRVIWKVNAQVLGQATDVEFTFDVQEVANGTLEGTLTALGNAFARVAVTMTRM